MSFEREDHRSIKDRGIDRGNYVEITSKLRQVA